MTFRSSTTRWFLLASVSCRLEFKIGESPATGVSQKRQDSGQGQ